MSSDKFVRTEQRGSVRVIRLVDERKRNALSYELRRDFSEAFYAAAGDPDVRALYITGTGSAFCSGGDLRMMRDEGDAWASHLRLGRTGRWLMDLMRCPKPVVVGVNGLAVGGGIGLAVAGDVVYAGEQDAKFMSGFMRLGLLPDIGMMYTLPRLVGMTRARSFVYEQQTWSARQAEEYGLITAAVPDDDLEERGLERAAALAAGPIEGFGLAKQLMARSFESSLEEMMTLEDFGQSLAYQTESGREGIAALTERREPDFVSASERENARKIERSRQEAQ